jgi:hypothetical protein
MAKECLRGCEYIKKCARIAGFSQRHQHVDRLITAIDVSWDECPGPKFKNEIVEKQRFLREPVEESVQVSVCQSNIVPHLLSEYD